MHERFNKQIRTDPPQGQPLAVQPVSAALSVAVLLMSAVSVVAAAGAAAAVVTFAPAAVMPAAPTIPGGLSAVASVTATEERLCP